MVFKVELFNIFFEDSDIVRIGWGGSERTADALS